MRWIAALLVCAVFDTLPLEGELPNYVLFFSLNKSLHTGMGIISEVYQNNKHTHKQFRKLSANQHLCYLYRFLFGGFVSVGGGGGGCKMQN